MLAEKIKENQGAQVINMPKKDNQGSSFIDNGFFEAVAKRRIPGEQMQILACIARKTWCWNKRSDLIAKSQISEATGIVKTHLDRAIKALIDRNIIKVTKNGNKTAQEFEINNDYSEWRELPKKVKLPNLVKTVTKKGNLELPNLVPSKDIIKDNTKDIKNSFPHFAEADKPEPEIQSSTKIKKLSSLSQAQAEKFKVFWEKYPKHRRKEKPKAERAFKAINPDEALFAEIMSGLEASVNSHDWQKDNGQFVCYPERFLKNQKWTDEHDNGKGFKKSSCPMSGYKPSTQTEATGVSDYIDPEEWFK